MLQCLSKYKKQQKVLSASLCLVSQKQNGNYKITQNSQQSCKDSKLMLIMFLVTSEKCPNNKKNPSSSLSETRVLWKLQCEVKHCSLKSQKRAGAQEALPAWMQQGCAHTSQMSSPAPSSAAAPSGMAILASSSSAWSALPNIPWAWLGLRADLSTTLSHTHW